MPSYVIQDISVEFPREPYSSQLVYMSHVLDALKCGENALLESPTGTGKTLCLLCSVLAFQNHIRNKNCVNNNNNMNNNNNNNMNKRASNVPVIVYASRTHTQLSQVISELKYTSYRPKMTILGSRDQLCIHPKLSKLSGTILNTSCSSLCTERKCMYRNNLENYSGFVDGSEGSRAPILDIEELILLSKKDNICGYYYSRTQVSDCDLVLLPYNYLLDPVIRATVEIDWNNAIVIFDEAHNLEKCACDAASISITSTIITSIIKECQDVIRILQSQSIQFGHDNNSNNNNNNNNNNISIGNVKAIKPKLESVANILKAVFELELMIDQLPIGYNEKFGGEKGNRSLALPGNKFLYILETCGFKFEQLQDNLIQLSRMRDLLITYTSDLLGDGNDNHINQQNEPKLINLSRLLSRVFRGMTRQQCESNSSDYKVYITEYKSKQNNGIFSTINQVPLKPVRKLYYWAFSPGIALEELKKIGVKSILLTSGTLSPLGVIQIGMKIPFNIQLENPHVIDNKQFWVGSIGLDINGKKLNSSFQYRDNIVYQDSLGDSILQILKISSKGENIKIKNNQNINYNLENKIIPQSTELIGGILIFFPSYDTMEKLITRWKNTQIYEQLLQIGGDIIIEPRGVTITSNNNNNNKQKSVFDNNDNLNYDYDNYNDTTATIQLEEKQLKDVVTQLDNVLRIKKRCIVFAVFQGKISEGIDFKDSRGRVIIVTGIPFAPMKDPWIVLKKEYLDELKRNNQINHSINNRNFISGSEWYMQTASRAVNQALGRIIRHQKDWGAIFLLDDRFLYDGQIQQLSKWLRPGVQKFENFTTGINSFREFLNNSYNDVELMLTNAVATIKINPIAYETNNTVSIDDNRIKTVEISSSKISKNDGFIDPLLLQSQSSTSNHSTKVSNLLPYNVNNNNNNNSNISNNSNIVNKNNDNVLLKKEAVRGLAGAIAANINPFAVVKVKKSEIIYDVDNEKDMDINKINNSISLPTYIPSVNSIIKLENEKKNNYINSNNDNTNNLNNIFIMNNKLSFEKLKDSYSMSSDLKKNIIREIKNKIKSLVSLEILKQFWDVIANVKTHQFKDMSNIQEFVNGILNSLTSNENNQFIVDIKIIIEIFDDLACLIPKLLLELYISAIKKNIQLRTKSYIINNLNLNQNKNQNKNKNKNNNLIMESDATLSKINNNNNNNNLVVKPLINSNFDSYGINASNLLSQYEENINSQNNNNNNNNNKNQEENKLWQPSKRAKLIVGSTIINKINNNNNNNNNIEKNKIKNNNNINNIINPLDILRNSIKSNSTNLKHLNNINNNNNNFENSQSNDSSDILADISNFKFQEQKKAYIQQECNICMEIAKKPCANKVCGHVCCEICWKKWFNSKGCNIDSSCPVCRKPATINSLVFVTVRD